MKKIFAVVAVMSTLAFNVTAFGAGLVGVDVSTTTYCNINNNSDDIYETENGERALAQQMVTKVNYVGDVAYSVEVVKADGTPHTYSINSDTLVIDAMTGEPKNIAMFVKPEQMYYFISDIDVGISAYSTTSYLQAIITNVPDGARCPTLHVVTDVSTVDNQEVIVLDDGLGAIDLTDNMSYFQMGEPKPLYIALDEVNIGDQALVWSSKSYQIVDNGQHSKPYQMMIISDPSNTVEPIDNSWQFMSNTDSGEAEVVEEPIAPEPVAPESIVTNGVPLPDIPEELMGNIAETVTMATPRALTHETVVSTIKENGKVAFLNSTDSSGVTTKYTIDENTLIIDSMSGKQLTLDNIGAGEKLYVYGNNPKPEIEPAINYAQAVLLNIPMGGGVPAMYKVTDITFDQGATRILVDDTDVKYVTLNSNMSVSSLITNDVTGRSGIAIGNRIFVWYENLYNSNEEVSTTDRNAVQMVVAPTLKEDESMSTDKVSMPAMIYNNRAYIGLRNASERIGLDIAWNGENKTTTISSDRRALDIKVGQTDYVSRPIGENMVGMSAPTVLNESFIGLDGNLYVDPMVFEVLGGYIVNIAS